MADYAEMYKVLLRSVTQAIDILQKAQQTTEEIYISADDPIIKIILPDNGNKNEGGDC